MKDYRLSEIKAICEKRKICKGCEFYELCDGYGRKKGICKVADNPPNYWQIDKDETKEQLIADLNKVAVRMNWGTIERTINDDGTNGMPYMIDVIARTIAYLRGENEDDERTDN